MLSPVQRRLLALTTVTAVTLSVAAPAFGGLPLAASGNATSVTATGADLNGVIARAARGTRWRFAYSPDIHMRRALVLTPALLLHGRVVAVERRITHLRPDTRYFWRLVVIVDVHHRTEAIDGARRSFRTGPVPVSSTTTTSTVPTATSTTTTSTAPTTTSPTAATPTTPSATGPAA
jgi:hypothetical protein